MNVAALNADRRRWVEILVVGLIFGYLAMSRSFAHIGKGPVYVGEMALVALLVGAGLPLLRPLAGALAHQGPITFYAWTLFISLVFGAAQCVRGVFVNDPMTAVKNIVVHLYPAFFFVGLFVGVRNPGFMLPALRKLAWAHAIYGLFFVLGAPRELTDAKADEESDFVGWLGQPYGASFFCLAMLIQWQTVPRKASVPLLMNLAVLLGMQVRAAWLSFSVAGTVWAATAGRLPLLLKILGALASVVVLGAALNLPIPSPATRITEDPLTFRDVLARGLVSVSPELAGAISEKAETFGDTISWRTEWWKKLWAEVITASPRNALIGPGYGYPIWDHHPVKIREGNLRTPHCIAVYCLSYTGFVGYGVFLLAQLALLRVMIRAYRASGNPLGICLWTLVGVWSLLDVIFEAPFVAIPFFLLCGLCAAEIYRPAVEPAEVPAA